jgi:hypothetical protein
VILYLIRNELVNNRLGIVLEFVRIPSSFAEVGRLLTGGGTEMPEREREKNKEKYDQEFDQKYDRCGPCGDMPEIGSVAMSRLLPPTLRANMSTYPCQILYRLGKEVLNRGRQKL